MPRLLLSLLLALAPALPAAAQVRSVAAVDAPITAAPSVVSALSPSLSVPGALLFPAAVAPASLSAVVPAAPAALPALPAAAAAAAGYAAPAPAARLSGDHAAPPSAVLAPANSRPVVLRSLQDLGRLLQSSDGSRAGAAAYDGSSDGFGSVSDAGFGKPRVLPGMPGVAVRSVRGGLSELQSHEVAMVRKIQVHAADLQVIVREAAATPDLVVNGVATELKTVHKGKFDRQLAHANVQLLAHAKRHGLGLGAVALDIIGSRMTPREIEDGIARVVRASPATGFARVYVFNGDDVKTYAPGADGAFRLDAAAKPFAPAPAAAVSFVPSALSRAILPDMDVITREIQEPSRLLRAKGIEATVTMYGSARILSPEKAQAKLDAAIAEVGPRPKGKAAKTKMDAAREALRMSKYYQIARELGALIAREGKGRVAVVTGGGPGIMEGGNRGAFEAGGPSVGYNIKLPMEQSANPYATPELEFTFEHFPTRQMAMRHGSMGLVYFPGGFGTMYELFEILTLMQTGKMPRTPIVLIGERAYWDRILDFDEFAHMGLISPGDLSLFAFAEDAPQAWAAIQAGHAASAVAAR